MTLNSTGYVNSNFTGCKDMRKLTIFIVVGVS